MSRLWMCLLALGAVLATGCGGALPKMHYYMLNLPAAPAPAPASGAPYAVAVMPFRVPDYLQQDRLAFRPSAVEVDFYEYHRWAQRPAAMLTEALVQRLRSRGVFSTVLVFDGRTRTDYLLRGRLNRLEEIDENGSVSVLVELSADMLDLKANRTVWSGAAAQSGTVSQGEVSDVVTALGQAAGASLDQITTGLEGFAKGLPPASGAAGGGTAARP